MARYSSPACALNSHAALRVLATALALLAVLVVLVMIVGGSIAISAIFVILTSLRAAGVAARLVCKLAASLQQLP